ncbi:ATP-binding protein [Saccharicrinis sp. GN24d3]|uniref:ATP-binding protein n=1 Tax=Saccharicrinis sp. GN24d3 TaxID=3458416 RepID=UPI00403569E8
MSFNFNYKRKLFLYYFSIFFIITSSFIAFQFNREKHFRIAQLENTLNTLTDLTSNYISKNNLLSNNNISLLDSLVQIIPAEDTRITIIDLKGNVLFDSFVVDYDGMENHLQRSEVQKAKYSDEGKGSNIRRSVTTGQEFYYYARNYNDFFVRVAVVYDIKVQNFLKAERLFLFFIAFIFIVTWFILSYVTRKMSESITKLKDFAVQLRQNKPVYEDYEFPQNELGVISKQIISMYKKLTQTTNALSLEKEKLIKHLFVLNEGVGFFSPDKKVVLTNTHFVQYLNLIAEKSSINPEHIFEIADLKDLQKFLKKHVEKKNLTINPHELPRLEFKVKKSGYFFEIKCIVFQDQSFEIYINDVTKLEKRRLLKQQMTSNIAHELKTPVASVSGFLETILNNKDMEEDKKDYFIEKAFRQSNRLTALIEDIVVLNRIEEGVDSYEFEELSVSSIVKDTIDNCENLIREHQLTVNYNIAEDVKIKGNRALVCSVFQNLLDNSISYAGEGVNIDIDMYHEDDEFYYFSVIDNGVGIPEEHLSRIFERFYRVDPGRSRKMGGTGLGLAIVKHAVNIHKGEVSVKNAPKGGAEFYISLPKYSS